MPVMGNTLKVIKDRAYDAAKAVLPAEYARGLYIEHAPGAQALKLMHLLIGKAGGALAEPRAHEIRLADIRAIEGMKNHDRTSLTPLFMELRSATFTYDDTDAQKIIIGGFFDHAKLDYRHEVSGDLVISWWFGGAFRELAEKSNHWAIMDRQTVFALTSKYSILLFQHIASLVNLDHKTSQTFSVQELRALLAVPEGKLKAWNDLNKRSVIPAIAEINQLARFTLTAKIIKVGRSVASVEITWEVKPDPTEAKRELNRPKTGRKPRRNGTAETPVAAFPASGGIRYAEPFGTLAKTHGNGKDIDLIANDFRAWAKGKFALDSKDVEKKFKAFCKGAKL